MLFGVFPRRIVLVLGSFQVVTKGNTRMMRRLLVVAGFMMLGGLTVMLGGLLVMLGSMFVMLVNFVLCHLSLPEFLLLKARGRARRWQPTRVQCLIVGECDTRSSNQFAVMLGRSRRKDECVRLTTIGKYSIS